MENREANEETQESRMDLTGRTLQKTIVGGKKEEETNPTTGRKEEGRKKQGK